ncbi:hypothetical protein BVG16_04270 [Paenibacillus selenitireducens]|uniref:DUF5658 domain-containing protein n=1 Tax=Paenibacillus selenitireducens TaxID=1324314 RepID=A0A1T2XJT5_9BACL|nr:DUF5658 family protein [Paenibacillus selenitireducens]OPA79976.1 hypothetical protein BVG16_04270 [Paenibacillus selenitireducens]
MTMTKDRNMLFIQAIILFSILDAFCTHLGISKGWVTEANPIASFVYQKSIVLFYLWKVLMPLFLLLLYPYIRANPLHKRLIQFTTVVYSLLMLYHAGWLLIVWSGPVI